MRKILFSFIFLLIYSLVYADVNFIPIDNAEGVDISINKDNQIIDFYPVNKGNPGASYRKAYVISDKTYNYKTEVLFDWISEGWGASCYEEHARVQGGFFIKDITNNVFLYITWGRSGGNWKNSTIGISYSKDITNLTLIKKYPLSDYGFPQLKGKNKCKFDIKVDEILNLKVKCEDWDKTFEQSIDISDYVDLSNYKIGFVHPDDNIESSCPFPLSDGYIKYLNYKIISCKEDYEEGFNKGKEYCKNNPSDCGIEIGYSDNDLEAKYEEGFNKGKEYCKNNPSDCGIEIGYSDNDNCSTDRYQEGFEAGKASCKNLSSTIVNCDFYDFSTRKLHINCVKAGEKKYWLDMPLNVDAMNNIYFTISNYGEVITIEDCEKLITKNECESHSDICVWEPGIFGVGGKCKPKQ